METFSSLIQLEASFHPEYSYYYNYQTIPEQISPTTESTSSANSSFTSCTASECEDLDNISREIYDLIPEFFKEPDCKPDYEATKSSLIKEGLKISLERKLLNRKETISIHNTPLTLHNHPQKAIVQIQTEQSTTDDEAKRQERKNRNKIAAKKCRRKRKMHFHELIVQEETVTRLNDDLRKESERLQQELDQLQKLLDQHNCAQRFGSRR